MNSVIVTTLAVLGELLSASFVAFGFARLRFPGRNFLFILLLTTMMIPYPVTMIPSFILWVRGLGMANTFGPLVLPPFFGPAFCIFLLRQFFLTINTELDEAAKVDGANEFRIYWQIILPLAKPALATIAVFSFIANWNDFLTPLIYLSDPMMYTLAIGINYLRNFRGGGELSLQMAAGSHVHHAVPGDLLHFAALHRAGHRHDGFEGMKAAVDMRSREMLAGIALVSRGTSPCDCLGRDVARRCAGAGNADRHAVPRFNRMPCIETCTSVRPRHVAARSCRPPKARAVARAHYTSNTS